MAKVVGSKTPRIFTPPLRRLSRKTSYGYDVVDFAREKLHAPLDPWEEWAVIHGGELLPDGRPRFRKLLILVARQNGKTHLLVVLSLYWLFVDQVAMILGTSTKLDYAKESWRKACSLARKTPELNAQIPPKGGIRKSNGEQELWRATEQEQEFEEGSRYKIAASNEEGGRSLTLNRLVMDELRQHHSYDAHDASVPAMSAVMDAQAWALSNMGDDRSIVLNDWRDAALEFIDTGEGDERLGLFEWSAPEDALPDDIKALAMANPNLGIRLDPEALLADARVAMAKGGQKLAGFKTEHMCIRVRTLDGAFDADAWKAGLSPGTLDGLRDRIGACLDVSPDGAHVTLAVAAEDAGKVRVELAGAWDSTEAARKALPGLLGRIRPRGLAWYPNGPAAALAADLRPFATTEIRGAAVNEVVMSLGDLIKAKRVLHSGDDLATAHVTGAQRLQSGDGWRVVRAGAGHVDAAYAIAGAIHVARDLPEEEKPLPRSAIY